MECSHFLNFTSVERATGTLKSKNKRKWSLRAGGRPPRPFRAAPCARAFSHPAGVAPDHVLLKISSGDIRNITAPSPQRPRRGGGMPSDRPSGNAAASRGNLGNGTPGQGHMVTEATGDIRDFGGPGCELHRLQKHRSIRFSHQGQHIQTWVWSSFLSLPLSLKIGSLFESNVRRLHVSSRAGNTPAASPTHCPTP